MTNVKWTEEQKEAIYTRDCNLLVAAAAGSGKTAVLVERIINIISNDNNPYDIDKLLVVTFTNAAASEMRERIAKALEDKIEKEPESKKFQGQLTLLSKASITTLHSFCLDIIRNNFHKIQLDPNFRVADETENILLKEEAMEELFDEKYAEENNENFIKLVEFYSNNRDDSNLQNIVLDLYNFIVSLPWPENWLHDAVEKFNIKEDLNFDDLDIIKLYKEYMNIKLKSFKFALKNGLRIIENEEELEPYEESLIEDIYIIDKLIKSTEGSFSDFTDEILNSSFKTLKRAKKGANESKKKRIQKIRNDIKDELKAIGEDIEFIKEPSSIQDIKELYPILKELSLLVIDFKNKFSRKKREKGVIDFNDFEHFALQILSYEDENGNIIPSEIALNLRKKYEEILIDEYQDTNGIQEAIINLIRRKGEVNGEFQGDPNVFMVGDIKQSIYRFRKAKPELFLKKYNNYSKDKDAKYRKVLLYKNFRSRKEVIDCINYIFKTLMSKSVGELDYTEEEYLNLGAKYENKEGISNNTEIHILNKKESEIYNEDLKEEDKPSDIQLESNIAINIINSLIEDKFKVFDKNTGEYRDIQYRDIVVLMRSTQNYAPIFDEEFKNNDIPCYADTGGGYFDTLEIKTMLSLLQIIDNPIQDIPLIAVLRSPIASFSEEELIDIRAFNKNISFYEDMIYILKEINFDEINKSKEELKFNNKNIYEKNQIQYNKDLLEYSENKQIENDDEDINKEFSIKKETLIKIKKFIDKLNFWRTKSKYMDLDQFVWYLYTETGYYGYVGAMPGGNERQANLRMLFQRASQYEKTSYKGLFNFINFINRLKQSNGDLGNAKTIGETENVVRIMSIHKSKGLEFPVVIVAGIGKRFNLSDMKKKILFHEELGFGPEYVNIEKRYFYDTLFKQIIKNKIKLENLSEEMRILYVALTRAKEKLILLGAVNDIEKSVAKWTSYIDDEEKINEYYVGKGMSYLDWIAPSIMKHEDGKVLRDYEESNIKIINDISKWDIKIWNREDLGNIDNNITEEIIEDINLLPRNEKKIKDIDNILSYEYKYKKSTKLPAVITVTELKKELNSNIIQDDEFSSSIFIPSIHKKPKFLEETKKMTGAERGTAIHDVMQRLSLDKVSSYEEIKAQIDFMVMKEFITEVQAESINIEKILEFFNSNLGKRMKKSNNVKREVPFHMNISSKELDKNLKDYYKDENIVLQGIIDCYFEEDDKIILLDYKTDYYKDINDIVNKYKIQLEYYSKALEKILKKSVSEKYLYLFYNDKDVLVK